MKRSKRVFVLDLNYNHLISAVAVLLTVALTAMLWPQPARGGEGGYAETLFYNAPISEDGAAAFDPKRGKARLAIIIDDFGQSREGVQEMMQIGRPLTFAVMPFGEFTKQDAENGYTKGYEIIVHLPMEPMHGQMSWLGKNPILCSQGNEKISSVTKMSLEDVPHAVGANVHMGSKASADSRVMGCILQEVARKGFFFVDSRTGANSVIKAMATEFAIPCLERNVFLDGQQPQSHIVRQLRQAQEIALKNGYAVAIGHVGVEGGKPTAAAITSMLAEFDRNGVELVFVSDLLGMRNGGPVAVDGE